MTTTTSASPLTATGLLDRPAVELDALFQDAPAGPVPVGRGAGTVIALPGGPLAHGLAAGGGVVWRGKIFRPETSDLKNLVTPASVPSFRAVTYEAPSWLDDRPCIVLDYSKSSRTFSWIRDEIRLVSPGVYLGIVWGAGRLFGPRRRALVLRFALTFGS